MSSWISGQHKVLAAVGDDLRVIGAFGSAHDPLFTDVEVSELHLGGYQLAGVALGAAELGERVLLDLPNPALIDGAMRRLREDLPALSARSLKLTLRAWTGADAGGGPVLGAAIIDRIPDVPGMALVLPSDAESASGLLRAALTATQPVLLVDSLRQRVSPGVASTAATSELAFNPIGTAHRVRAGSALTILCWGSAVVEVLDSVALAEVDAEVLDLRTLFPLDIDAIGAAIRRTGRFVVAADGVARAERILASAVAQGFWRLEAPPRVIEPRGAALMDALKNAVEDR